MNNVFFSGGWVLQNPGFVQSIQIVNRRGKLVKLDPINPTANKETAVINNTNDNENTVTTSVGATDNDSDYHIMTNKKFVSDIQFNKGIQERKIRWGYMLAHH